MFLSGSWAERAMCNRVILVEFDSGKKSRLRFWEIAEFTTKDKRPSCLYMVLGGNYKMCCVLASCLTCLSMEI